MTLSGDFNLNNPTSIDQIDLQYEMFKPAFKVQWVSQYFYDQLQAPDPLVCYIISDATDNRMYYGRTLVLPEKHKGRYLIGQEKKGEWILFLNEGGRLISVCRYDNPQSAINALEVSNKIGSHHELNIKIYNILISYINGDMDVNTALIGIISDAGYKEHPKLQDLIQWTYRIGCHRCNQRDRLEKEYLPYLHDLDEHADHMLFNFYIRIYEEVFRANDYFNEQSKVEDKTSLNLSSYIDKIISILFMR